MDAYTGFRLAPTQFQTSIVCVNENNARMIRLFAQGPIHLPVGFHPRALSSLGLNCVDRSRLSVRSNELNMGSTSVSFVLGLQAESCPKQGGGDSHLIQRAIGVISVGKNRI